MIEGLQQGLKEEGFTVSISKLCQWFNVPRRTVYYKPCKAPPKLNSAWDAARLAETTGCGNF